jgi:hypothetical protein
VIRIAQESKVQLLLGFEAGEGLFRIGACAQDNNTGFVEFFLCVAKLGRLTRSAGSIGSREEIENDALAFEVGKRNLFTLVGFQREVWSFVSNFEHESPQ